MSSSCGCPGRLRPRPLHPRTQPENHERVKAWLRGLGDGYMLFDREDLFAKVEGPLVVEESQHEQCVALGDLKSSL